MKRVKYDKISDVIVKLHEIAREIDDHKMSFDVRILADDLAKIGNALHDREIKTSESISQ